ncbi:MAG: helix-turn-helix transcriptional regulator [Myxococcales bacterium]|nr:helix-turn-helix transcriptional regulator [Myxococcales bacterium]
MPSFDPISVVETAYRLDVTTDQWLLALAHHALPSLGRGLGVQAMIFGAQLNKTAPLGMANVGASPEVEGYLRSLNTTTPDAGMRFLYEKNMGRLISLSEMLSSEPCDDIRYDRVGGSELARAVVDHVALYVPAPPDRHLFVGALSFRKERTSAQDRQRWGRIGAHLGAGLRLREAGIRATTDAVLEVDGRCVHAEGDARAETTREAFSRHVRAIERARGPRRATPDEALDLWQGLVRGRWSLVDRWESDGRRYVVARHNPPPSVDPRRLSKREAQVVELAARGHANKYIGYALGLQESTVSTLVGRALRKLGMCRREELAWALSLAVTRELSWAGERLVVQVCEDLGQKWEGVGLSPGERAVALLAASGASNREIASLRGTSPRTIANQLHHVFQKLRIGSRAELSALVCRPPPHQPPPLDDTQAS